MSPAERAYPNRSNRTARPKNAVATPTPAVNSAGKIRIDHIGSPTEPCAADIPSNLL
jgi:hypothetical protein